MTFNQKMIYMILILFFSSLTMSFDETYFYSDLMIIMEHYDEHDPEIIENFKSFISERFNTNDGQTSKYLAERFAVYFEDVLNMKKFRFAKVIIDYADHLEFSKDMVEKLGQNVCRISNLVKSNPEEFEKFTKIVSNIAC